MSNSLECSEFSVPTVASLSTCSLLNIQQRDDTKQNSMVVPREIWKRIM